MWKILLSLVSGVRDSGGHCVNHDLKIKKQILIECSSFDIKYVPSFRNIVTRFTNTGSRECLLKALRISVFQGNVLHPTTIFAYSCPGQL